MTSPAPHRMLEGRHVFRVVSKLNTDLLVGHCWCGTSYQAGDPVELWEWLLAHPATHDDTPGQGDAPGGDPDHTVTPPDATPGRLVSA